MRLGSIHAMRSHDSKCPRPSNQAVKLRPSVGRVGGSAVDTTVNSCCWFLAASVQRARGGVGAAVKYGAHLSEVISSVLGRLFSPHVVAVTRYQAGVVTVSIRRLDDGRRCVFRRGEACSKRRGG